MRMSKELRINKACFTFLRSSELSWLASIILRVLWHWENLKTSYQKRVLDLQLLYTNWKNTSHNLGGIAYVYQLERHESRRGWDYQYLPIGKAPVTIWSSSLLANKNDTLQAGADNDQCTWACGDLYRPYSPTRPTTASPTRLSATEVQFSPPSSGPPGTTFELDCSYHLRAFYENLN